MLRAALAAAAAAAARLPPAAPRVASAPFPPPPIVKPWLYFGANETGLTDNAIYTALAANSSLSGYGWQNNAAPSAYRHGEANLLAAARALSAAAPGLPVFVYRNFQINFDLFDVQRANDADPSRGMFLRDHDNAEGAAECRQAAPGGGTVPLFAFVNKSAGEFWVDKVIAEVAAEGAVSALFMDECDWSACGYNFKPTGCSNISDEFRLRDLTAKLPAIRATADALNAANKWPIFSSKNLLDAAWAGLPASATRPCVAPHDAFAAALAGAFYARFYEFFMGQGPDLDAATIQNAILEGAAGVGLVARTQADAAAQCAATCTAGYAGKASLSYALAAFLVARTSPYSYFGVSAGWYSPCWCWHAEFDAASSCGAPVAAAVRASPYAWTREYENCVVKVNTSAMTGSFGAQ